MIARDELVPAGRPAARTTPSWSTLRNPILGLVLGGVVAGAASGSSIGLYAAYLIVPVLMVAATAAIGGVGLRPAVLVTALGVSTVVFVHHGPDVVLFEPLVLWACLWLVLTRLWPAIRATPLAAPRVVAAASLALVAMSALFVVWRPVDFGAGNPLRELEKNVDIVLLALGGFAYASSPRRFRLLYALLTMSFVAELGRALFTVRGHAFDVTSLQTEAPLAILALAGPFIRDPRVAPILGVAATLLLVSRTRGGWLMAIVLAIVIGSTRFRRVASWTLRAVLAGVAGLIVAIALVAPLRARIDPLLHAHDQSVHDRLQLFHGALLEFWSHPLTGVGPGNFKPWILATKPNLNFWIGTPLIPRDPHDVYLKFAAEMGVAGVIVIALWTFGVLAMLRAVWRAEVGRAFARYQVGVVLYGVLWAFALLVSEWGSVARIQLALGGALLLSVARLFVHRPEPR